MDLENCSVTELSIEDLQSIFSQEDSLGSFDEMKEGQELHIPIAKDAQGYDVFYGPVDYSGKSNDLSFEKWTSFIKEQAGFEPLTKTILKKSSDNTQMWIYARASSSIGPCDSVAVFPSLIELLDFMLYCEMDAVMDDEATLNLLKDQILAKKDLTKAEIFCRNVFDHSFFTGLVYGPFEHVSGPKPLSNGYVAD